jgi:Skp family chaperone for outer membrane proteins
MTRNGRWLLLAVLSVGASAAVEAQQRLTNFAVVEVSRIQAVYFRESSRLKEYEAFRTAFRQELEKMQSELDALRTRRTEANRASNQSEVARLDTAIANGQTELETYRRLKEQQRLRMLDDLLSNDRFYRDLRSAVQWVCNQGGYSGAFDLDETLFLWWDPSIDITDDVIARMAAQ